MQTIHVSRDFDIDAETIFDVISDHEGYSSLPGVRAAWLRVPGESVREGVGAERVIQLMAFHLVEQITEYKPGEALGYRIIESPLPIHHLGSRILLQPLGSTGVRTRVHWTSRLRGKTPIAADWTALAIAQQMRLAYRGALEIWARRIT